MSYQSTVEYRIVPTQTFRIVRGCAGCGSKQIFVCKNNFRVNANGNRLDIWLIYGCEKCGHTYNLPIYERIRPNRITQQEYQAYLANDAEKVMEIGTSKAIFSKNKAEIAWNLLEYEIVPLQEETIAAGEKAWIQVDNPYNIPVREDKIVARILGVTRSEAKKLLKSEAVCVRFRTK